MRRQLHFTVFVILSDGEILTGARDTKSTITRTPSNISNVSGTKVIAKRGLGRGSVGGRCGDLNSREASHERRCFARASTVSTERTSFSSSRVNATGREWSSGNRCCGPARGGCSTAIGCRQLAAVEQLTDRVAAARALVHEPTSLVVDSSSVALTGAAETAPHSDARQLDAGEPEAAGAAPSEAVLPEPSSTAPTQAAETASYTERKKARDRTSRNYKDCARSGDKGRVDSGNSASRTNCSCRNQTPARASRPQSQGRGKPRRCRRDKSATERTSFSSSRVNATGREWSSGNRCCGPARGGCSTAIGCRPAGRG